MTMFNYENFWHSSWIYACTTPLRRDHGRARLRRIGQRAAICEVLPQAIGHRVAQLVRLRRQHAGDVGMDRGAAEAGEGGAGLGFACTDVGRC